MGYWRSTSGSEADLILDNKWEIEIKGTKSVYESHLKGLRALRGEGVIENFTVVSRDRNDRKIGGGIVADSIAGLR